MQIYSYYKRYGIIPKLKRQGIGRILAKKKGTAFSRNARDYDAPYLERS